MVSKIVPGLAAAALVVVVAVASQAQDGPLRRAGRALDNAGKNVRARVEGEIVRGQITADERDMLARVHSRVRWDKKLVAAPIQIEVQPDLTVVLRGTVADEEAKARAVDLASSTVGVSRVVDELVIGKEVRVIESRPIGTETKVIVPSGETKVIVPGDAKVVVPGETKVIVPGETKVIVK